MRVELLILIFAITLIDGCEAKSSEEKQKQSIKIDKVKDRHHRSLSLKINLDRKSPDYYKPTRKDIEYNNILKANPNNFCDVIKNAPSKSTIEFEDGIYLKQCAFKNKSYITIRSKHKFGAHYKGDEFFLELLDKNHHINIIGIEVESDQTKYDSGLLHVHGYGHYENNYIYVRDCWIHDSGSGVLTSPKNHDITIDHCLFNDIKMGYYFYALGWHLAFVNSVAYHPENNGVALRGYIAPNRYYSYEDAKTRDVTKDKDAKPLPKDDWTHYVAGNFFGEGYGRNAKRDWERGSAVAFYIGRGNKDGDDAYFPPQNVIIEKNIFYNITPSRAKNGDIFDGAITIDAEAGFGDSNKTALQGTIFGTIIRENISNVELLKSFWTKPDMSLIGLKGNKKESSKVLQSEFKKRVDELKDKK